MRPFDKARGLLSRLRHHIPHLNHRQKPQRVHIPDKDVYQIRPAGNMPRAAPLAQNMAQVVPKPGIAMKVTNLSELSKVYKEEETLGSGMSGAVKKAVHIPSGQLRAVKKIKLEPGSDYLFRSNFTSEQLLRLNQTNDEKKDCAIRAAREVCGLQRVDHPSIVKLHEMFLVGDLLPQTKKTLVLGMEFVDGRNLNDETYAAGHLSEEKVGTYLLPVAEALHCLHRKGLVHRDVKADNILCEKTTGKLIDLGFTRLVSDDPLASLCGSELYAAPELWLRQKYDGKKADVWSLGVTMYVAAIGYMPFGDAKEICGNQLQFPASPRLTDSLKDLILRMVDKNPKTRPSMAEVLAHPWMRNAQRVRK